VIHSGLSHFIEKFWPEMTGAEVFDFEFGFPHIAQAVSDSQPRSQQHEASKATHSSP
jgi:hypothetical protein